MEWTKPPHHSRIFTFFLPNNLCVGKKVTVPQLAAKIDAPESFRFLQVVVIIERVGAITIDTYDIVDGIRSCRQRNGQKVHDNPVSRQLLSLCA